MKERRVSILKVQVKENKKIFRSYLAETAAADPDDFGRVTAKYYHEDAVWHGPHPLNNIQGVDDVLARVWSPLSVAMPDLERRNDIVMGGSYNGKDWIGSTGHYLGTFEKDWLGIPATRSAAYLRFGEFHHFENNKISESFVIFDILDLMRQAGVWLLPPSLGVAGLAPGPATQDGLLWGRQDDEESVKSLKLVEAMAEGLFSYDGSNLASMGQDRFWHPRMMWYGPAGIGATRGLKGFEDYHQRPFLSALPDRVGGYHYGRFGDGMYTASGGWPSLRATHSGPGWLGLPPTNRKIEMRVMDFWRREGDLLRENWVFIDIIDVLLQLDVDLFDQMRFRLHKSD